MTTTELEDSEDDDGDNDDDNGMLLDTNWAWYLALRAAEAGRPSSNARGAASNAKVGTALGKHTETSFDLFGM